MSRSNTFSTTVIGGCGHIGLPFAVANALADRTTYIYDTNEKAVLATEEGNLLFKENGLQDALKKALKSKNLRFLKDPAEIRKTTHIVVTIGTPVDKYLNPGLKPLISCLEPFNKYMSRKTLIIRSTVFPGAMEQLRQYYVKQARGPDQLCYCPERALQGDTLNSLKRFPQIVSSFSSLGVGECSEFFSALCPAVIEATIQEAELAKLFTNAYRYIHFSIANEFYEISKNLNVDYRRLEGLMRAGYPRMGSFPTPGLTGGTCLTKDTLMVNHVSNFRLGQAAFWINESFPHFLVNQLKKTFRMDSKCVGILGLAFKAESDDKRESLSCRLYKLLEPLCRRVMVHDPYVKDERVRSLDDVVKQSHILIIATPHEIYNSLIIPNDKYLLDPWNLHEAKNRL